MSSARRLVTERLVIATATTQHILVELGDPAKLEPLLGARVPEQWPRDAAEQALLRDTMTRLQTDGPAAIGWWLRYVVLRKGPDGHPLLAGRVGLHGPAQDGEVRVWCALLPALAGDGHGREATGALVDWAFDHPGVERVVAEPAAAHEAWIDDLRALGFAREGDELDPLDPAAERGTGRLVRHRAAWQQDSVALRRGAKLVPREPHVPVAGIPRLARATFERLLAEPLRDPEDLRREVVLYVNLLASAAADDPSVDHELGRDIGRTCEGLLMAIGETTPEHARRQIQAAVRYFVTEDDGDGDLGIGGLDEDAAVANAVALHLGRSDLAVSLD